jgi:glucuronokinase
MIIQEIAYARSGLIGNPSDIFNGKVISFLFDKFFASITLYETPQLKILANHRDNNCFNSLDDLVKYRKQFGYYGGIRIIEALIVRFKQYCNQNNIYLEPKNFTIEYDSTVPFGIGLGGSSTIIKAILSALMKFYGLTENEISKPIQANVILEAETKELGISAGPQDRVVAVFGGLVYMDFTEEAFKANDGQFGHYYNLDTQLLPPLFIAYTEKLSKSSGEVHNIMRYRIAVEHDEKVIKVMRAKAKLVDEAREVLLSKQFNKLGPLMSRDFELRKQVYNISEENLKLIQIAENLDSHANFTGSGGAVVGVYEDEAHYKKLEAEYNKHNFQVIKANVKEYF